MHDVLIQLAERSTDREHELLRYSSTREVKSDGEAGAESPIFDSFYSSGGSEAVVKMITSLQPSSANCTTYSMVLLSATGTMAEAGRFPSNLRTSCS